ncbi:hypothetical protein JXJ21_05490 [candidate division KSB1 bacterium]|nr:hypothetical protein [candidate division KSB1 bacterium]
MPFEDHAQPFNYFNSFNAQNLKPRSDDDWQIHTPGGVVCVSISDDALTIKNLNSEIFWRVRRGTGTSDFAKNPKKEVK